MLAGAALRAQALHVDTVPRSSGGKRPAPELEAAAFHALCHYTWPRNVRELKDVIERAVLLAGDVITLAHLPCQELAPVVSVRRVS